LPVIVVCARDDPRTVRQALIFGAQAFLSKSADAGTIGRHVTSVLRGDCLPAAAAGANSELQADAATLDLAQGMAQLTGQQFRVFGMLCSGRRNKEIGLAAVVSLE
jgi:DNA-binding NarL/FixJ family response regulator